MAGCTCKTPMAGCLRCNVWGPDPAPPEQTGAQAQRQQTRRNGQYRKMDPCPQCGKRRAVEPCYTLDADGSVPNDCAFAGEYACRPCINKDRKRAGLDPLESP